MTVKDLIEELQKYDKDMVVATDYDVFEDVIVEKRTWTHTNYPYDKPDMEFVSIS